LTLGASADQNTGMPVPRVTKEELKQRLEAADPATRPTVVDARLKYPYEHSSVKIPGSIRIAPGEVPVSSLPRDRDIVAYDSDPHELAGSRVATALIKQGFRVQVLKGGIVEWLDAKFPTETKDLPRQSAPAPGALKD
jgi:rhodanese-related sulfurtransferase